MTPPAATAAGRLGANLGAVGVPSKVPARKRGGSAPARVSAPASARRRISGGSPRTTSAAAPQMAPAATIAADRAPRVAVADRGTDQSFAILSRSRALIAGFAVLLAGLVFLENHSVSLNSAVGVSVQKISRLERDNALLRSSISSLSSDQRVVAQAKRLGFVEPPVGSSQFLGVNRGDAAEAASTMAPAQAGTAYASAGLDASSATNDQGVPGTDTSGVAATVDPSQSEQTGGAITTAAVPVDGATGTGG